MSHQSFVKKELRLPNFLPAAKNGHCATFVSHVQ